MHKLFVTIYFLRTSCIYGYVITASTTNTPTPTPILTTPLEDFSFRTAAGSWCANTLTLLRKERLSTSPI